ncbi:MAG: PEP-CTERM sorting domain-containing protein, partial [Symploca sp. SIO2B6]|nr:PEP-CTERM sorting domain-containing protein [Symploca sp. SIO2B6]
PNTGEAESRSDFTLVTEARIVENEEWTGGNTGAASADKGVDATIGLSKENITPEDIANADRSQQSVLTNLNLNSIVDTEENGRFAIDLIFQHAVDNVLLWERGMNSRLEIQAIGADGEVVEGSNTVYLGNRANGGVKEGFTPWDDTGIGITTTEIKDSDNPIQFLGSRGVSKTDFGLGLDSQITGIRLLSRYDNIGEYGGYYNGPDFKVMGTIDPRYDPQAVPEPFALAGLAVVGGAIATRRRQS